MKFNKAEQETVITYDHSTGEWNFYTSVTSHINCYMKNPLVSNKNIEVLTRNEGIPTSIRFTPDKSIVRKNFLRTNKQRVLSQEQIKAMQQGRGKRK